MLIFVSGEAGAGKSTWADLAAQILGADVWSTGDALRRHGYGEALFHSAFGPDDQVEQLLYERLLIGAEPTKSLIIDGFPRRPHQVNQMIEVTKQVFGRAWYPGGVRVVWFRIAAERAIRRYVQAGLLLSPELGKIGSGPGFTDPIDNWFIEKRKQQDPELHATFMELLHRRVAVDVGPVDLAVLEGWGR